MLFQTHLSSFLASISLNLSLLSHLKMLGFGKDLLCELCELIVYCPRRDEVVCVCVFAVFGPCFCLGVCAGCHDLTIIGRVY